MSTRITTGNSSPFALWTVIRRTPSLRSASFGGQVRRNIKRMEAPETMAVVEQLFVADREERSPQRRENGKFVVRPFDRRQRGAQRLDLGAVVKRAAANEQVRNAARFERLHIAAGHVFVVADEPAEQQADMTSLNRHEVFGFARLEAFRTRDSRRVG